jgi:hypothetical protein
MKFRYFNSDATVMGKHADIRFTDGLERPFRLSATQPAHQLNEMQFLSFLKVPGHCEIGLPNDRGSPAAAATDSLDYA